MKTAFKPGRRLGVIYPFVTKLRAGWLKSVGTASPYMAKVVCNPGGFLCEMAVSFIYDQRIVFCTPNGKGGQTFVYLTWDEVEYPRYSMAARGAVATDAQALYPIDEKTGKSKKEKQEALRQDYIEDHWQDVYNGIMLSMINFDARQAENVTDWRHEWTIWMTAFSNPLREAYARIGELERRTEP